MKKQIIISALAAVAALNPEGYTVDAATLQPVCKGYAVAFAATQNSFGPEGLARVVDFVANNEKANAFGGWLDVETGLYYYDAVAIIMDRKEAERLGRANGQIAIFDLENLQEIRL